MHHEKVEFMPPKDFRVPEDVGTEEDFDVVCSFRAKPDGHVCMTKMGDVDMPGYEKSSRKQNKPDYKEMAGQMNQAMGGGNPGGNSGGY